MDRKSLTTILALVLIGSFFMPYLKDGPVSASGFEILITPKDIAAKDFALLMIKYIWLLLPLSGIILLIGALNKGKYFIARWPWAFLPLVVLLFVVAKIYLDAKRVGPPATISEIAGELGFGFWVALAASVILAVYHPRSKA